MKKQIKDSIEWGRGEGISIALFVEEFFIPAAHPLTLQIQPTSIPPFQLDHQNHSTLIQCE